MAERFMVAKEQTSQAILSQVEESSGTLKDNTGEVYVGKFLPKYAYENTIDKVLLLKPTATDGLYRHDTDTDRVYYLVGRVFGRYNATDPNLDRAEGSVDGADVNNLSFKTKSVNSYPRNLLAFDGDYAYGMISGNGGSAETAHHKLYKFHKDTMEVVQVFDFKNSISSSAPHIYSAIGFEILTNHIVITFNQIANGATSKILVLNKTTGAQTQLFMPSHVAGTTPWMGNVIYDGSGYVYIFAGDSSSMNITKFSYDGNTLTQVAYSAQVTGYSPNSTNGWAVIVGDKLYYGERFTRFDLSTMTIDYYGINNIKLLGISSEEAYGILTGSQTSAIVKISLATGVNTSTYVSTDQITYPIMPVNEQVEWGNITTPFDFRDYVYYASGKGATIVHIAQELQYYLKKGDV